MINIKRITDFDKYCKESSNKFYGCSYNGNIYDSEIDKSQSTKIFISPRTEKKYSSKITEIKKISYEYYNILENMFSAEEEPTTDGERIRYFSYSILKNDKTNTFDIVYYVADIFKNIKEIERVIIGLYECQMKLNDIYVKQENAYIELVKNV